jgi:hypothetical protein
MPEEPLPFVALTILPGQFLTRPVENQLTPSDRMRLAKSEENAELNDLQHLQPLSIQHLPTK